MTSKLYGRVCLLVLFFVAASASFNGYFDKWPLRGAGMEGSSGTHLDAMVDGTAARPFVYRQLLPTLANWVDGRIPEKITDRLFTAKGHHGVPYRERLFDSPLAQSRTYFLRYAIVYTLVFLFAWIAVQALYLLGKSLGYPPATSALAAIAVILLMPYLLTGGGYLYDYPELAFFALAAWMALEFDWWWIIPLAALAAWNKESFLFFVPALYPLLRCRSSRVTALAGTATLGLVCGLVYCYLRFRFQYNPGATVEINVMDQIRYLLHPSDQPLLEKTYGLMLPRTLNPLTVVLVVSLLWRGWRNLPQAIQRHAQIAAVINFPLFLLFGAPAELRGLSMLYVTLFLLLAANMKEWFGGYNNAVIPAGQMP